MDNKTTLILKEVIKIAYHINKLMSKLLEKLEALLNGK